MGASNSVYLKQMFRGELAKWLTILFLLPCQLTWSTYATEQHCNTNVASVAPKALSVSFNPKSYGSYLTKNTAKVGAVCFLGLHKFKFVHAIDCCFQSSIFKCPMVYAI